MRDFQIAVESHDALHAACGVRTAARQFIARPNHARSDLARIAPESLVGANDALHGHAEAASTGCFDVSTVSRYSSKAGPTNHGMFVLCSTTLSPLSALSGRKYGSVDA